MTKEAIIKYKPENEFFIDEQCFITELSNSAADELMSVAQARVKPGISTHWHKLKDTTERYVILEGTGLVEIGDIKQQVCPKDVVIIPPGCRQRITNNSDKDLIFLAICTPRFTPTCYIDLSGE